MRRTKASLLGLALIATVAGWSGCVTETTIDEPAPPPTPKPAHRGFFGWLLHPGPSTTTTTETAQPFPTDNVER